MSPRNRLLLFTVLFVTGLVRASADCPAPISAGVEQVGPDAVQFWMDFAQPLLVEAGKSATYMWFVDADNNPDTGQNHGSVGSEYNIRVVVEPSGYGTIDVIDCSRPNPTAVVFVLGNRLCARVALADLENPTCFGWNYGYFTSGGCWGGYGVLQTFTKDEFTAPDNQPVTVLIDPIPAFRDGLTDHAAEVRAFNRKGERLSLNGRAVETFTFSQALDINGQALHAHSGTATQCFVSAAVDGVVSANTAEVVVGAFEVYPAEIHLDTMRRPSASVALHVYDALGDPIDLAGHSVNLFVQDADVATLTDGTVTALETGRGRLTGLCCIFDGMWVPACCAVRVMNTQVDLLPEVEARGDNVSFWYAPIDADPPPISCSFEEMVSRYSVPQTLGTIWSKQRELTGSNPWRGHRQQMTALCNDDIFAPCGWSGQPIVLGYDPIHAVSCVQLGYGPPHWGVMSHEMGHNFVGDNRSINRALCDGMATGISYSEGLATLCNMWSRQSIVDEPGHYGVPSNVIESFLDPAVYDSLPFHRMIFGDSLAAYESGGAVYPDAFDANVLDGMFIQLADDFGWSIYPKFFAVFRPGDATLGFTPADESERATLFVAAISAAARADLRGRFTDWGFPIQDELFHQLLPEFMHRAYRYGPEGLSDIAIAKTGNEGRLALLNAAVVSAAFEDCYYVQSADRTSGIRVYCGTAMSPGDCVRLCGPVVYAANGEPCIDVIGGAKVWTEGGNSPAPLGMGLRQVGGGPFGLQPGLAGGLGLNNTGLLVRVCGKVRGVDRSPTPGWFTISDGGPDEVKCEVPNGFVIDPGWDRIAVTGISSCEPVDGQSRRLIRVRGQDDVTAY